MYETSSDLAFLAIFKLKTMAQLCVLRQWWRQYQAAGIANTGAGPKEVRDW
jgi:hypothetical protein